MRGEETLHELGLIVTVFHDEARARDQPLGSAADDDSQCAEPVTA